MNVFKHRFALCTVSSAFSAFIASTTLVNATEQATTVGQQLIQNKFVISLTIGGFIVAVMCFVGIAKAMYRKAAGYGLRGVLCWQFMLQAFFCIFAFIVATVMHIREVAFQDVLGMFIAIVAPSFLIAAASNIRKSTLNFGICWTLLQLIQAMFVGFVVAGIIFKIFEKSSVSKE